MLATACDPFSTSGSGSTPPPARPQADITDKDTPPGPTTLEFMPSGPNGTMIAVGDSFGSGEGSPEMLWRWAEDMPIPEWQLTKQYQPGTNDAKNLCHRSVNAAAFEAAKTLGMTLRFLDCSGATTQDYWHPKGSEPVQRTALEQHRAEARLVSVFFGGNNVGFGKVADSLRGS